MKVGKKALSLLLAMIMIMSSLSVSFSVFAATSTTNDIYSAIVMHHDSLMDAIDKATKGPEDKRDNSGVPVKNGSTWEVKRDTLNGGWLAVSRAIASYAKGTYSSNKTYVDLYDKIIADAKGYATSNGYPVEDFEAILGYYKFGSNATGTFATQETVTLNIGPGFDLLAFKDVASIEDKTYSTAVLKFTPKGELATGYTLSSADDISFTTTDFVEAGTDVAVIKGVLEQCIAAGAFKAWFSKGTLETDELAAMTNLLALFDTTMAITGLGYTEAQIWDHYVAPQTGKTYGETKAWFDNAGARAEAEPKASKYKTDLDALMNTSLDGMNAFALKAHKDAVEAVIQEMDNDQFSVLVYQIINENENYIGKTDSVVNVYLKELGVKVGQAYATVQLDASGFGLGTIVLADKLVELSTAMESLKSAADVEIPEGTEWKDTAEYQANFNWWMEAKDVVNLVDIYVLANASFADIKDIKSAAGNAITEEIYNKVADKVGKLTYEIEGGTYAEGKAEMDAVMANTILTGRNYATIAEICDDFVVNYNEAVHLRDTASLNAVYTAIYPDGLDAYAEYIQTMKAAAAKAY